MQEKNCNNHSLCGSAALL